LAILFFQGQELIDDQFFASISRPTDSGFAQPEVLANLRCRQTQVPNRPVGQNTTGTYPIGLFSSDNHLVFFNAKDFCNPYGNQRPTWGTLVQNVFDD
jgi:hypothetical protein